METKRYEYSKLFKDIYTFSGFKCSKIKHQRNQVDIYLTRTRKTADCRNCGRRNSVRKDNVHSTVCSLYETIWGICSLFNWKDDDLRLSITVEFDPLSAIEKDPILLIFFFLHIFHISYFSCTCKTIFLSILKPVTFAFNIYGSAMMQYSI